MNLQVLPRGVWPVMLTPFKEDGAVDWAAYDELIDFYIEGGSAGLFAVCLSSEIADLTSEESLELARRAKARANQLPVVAGAICGGTLDDMVLYASRMAETGVDAVVVAPNQFAGEAEDESVVENNLFAFIERMDSSIPLGIYECPYPYHRHVSASLLQRIARTGRFVFMKDTCANPEVIKGKIEATEGTPMRVYNAHALSLIQSCRMGASGYSGVGANFFLEPYLCACAPKIHGSARLEAADQLMRNVQDCIRNSSVYPGFAKYFLHRQGLSMLPVGRTPFSVHPHWDDFVHQLVQQKNLFCGAAEEKCAVV